jgi:hypothetical protein
MVRIASRHVFEAEELLEEVQSWTEEEISALPKFYREKTRQYRCQAKAGED